MTDTKFNQSHPQSGLLPSERQGPLQSNRKKVNRVKAAVEAFKNPPTIKTDNNSLAPVIKNHRRHYHYNAIAEAAERVAMSNEQILKSVQSFISRNAPKSLAPSLRAAAKSFLKTSVARASSPVSQVGSFSNNFGYSLGAGNEIQALATDYYAARLYPGPQPLAAAANSGLVREILEKPIRDALNQGWGYMRKHDDIDPKFLDWLEDDDRKTQAVSQIKQDMFWRDVFGVRVIIHKMIPDRGSFPDQKVFYENPYEGKFVNSDFRYERLSNDPLWTIYDFSKNNIDSFLPSSPDFFEPPAWRVLDLSFHKSHCTVMRCRPVSQFLKPIYQFGGLGYVEPMIEHVYRYESLLNEFLSLLKTMRTFAIKGDAMAMSDNSTQAYLENAIRQKDNHGAILLGQNEELQMLSTPLGGIADAIRESSLAMCAVRGIPRELVLMDSVGGLNVNNLTGRNAYERICSAVRMDAEIWIHDRILRKMELVKDKFPDEYSKGVPFIKWPALDPFKKMDAADYIIKTLSALGGALSQQVLSPEQVDNFINQDPDLPFSKPSNDFKNREVGSGQSEFEF